MEKSNPTIGQIDIVRALGELGVRPGQTLMVHSFLGAFGKIEGGMETVLAALKEAVGEKGTLVFPTYNYDFCHGTSYDDRETPSQVGQLTEFVRKREEAIRTFHPVYSHAVIGAKQEYYSRGLSKSGFGKGSLFDRLRGDPDAYILYFGVDWNLGTFIHHVEESLQVPYRFVKKFPGQVTEQGKVRDYTAEIFSRYLELGIVINLRPFQQYMLEIGKNKQVALGRGTLSLVKVSDYFENASEQYQKHPFYFLATPLDYSKLKKEATNA